MRFILPALALLSVVAASQARQSSNGITVTPFSDFRDQTGYDGAESPNGKFFATADLADNYVFFNRSTGRWTTDSTLKPWQMHWSPDGRFLSFTRSLPGTRDRYVWVVPMDTATGRPSGTPRRVGMTAQQLRNASEPYRSSRRDGTGLGLKIARRIVASYNGTLQLVSAPGEGTTVRISLPVT